MHNAAIAAVLGIGVIVTGAAAYKAYSDYTEEKRINELIKYAELGADPNAEYSGYSVEELGEGCFKIEKPLYDPAVIQPSQYYYPQEVSQELLEELLVKQMEGARQSAEYVKKLCREYSQL